MRSAVLTLLGLLALATPAIVARLEGRGDVQDWLTAQPEDRVLALEGLAVSGMLLLAAAVAVS
jgi:hypothetical protein